MYDYLASKRDRDIIDAGGFYCAACLIGKPLDDISPDPRYCLGCYEFLLKEAEMVHPSRKPPWVPRQPEIAGKKLCGVSQHGAGIMATVKDKKSEVAIIQPTVATGTLPKRGPKQKVLPIDLIMQWTSEGMGYKRISARLKVEHGIEVGFRTIARVVKGERLLF